MSEIPPRLQQILDGLEGEQGAPLAELAQVLPSKSKRQIQHFLRLLAEEGKASALRFGPGAAWKSMTSASSTLADE